MEDVIRIWYGRLDSRGEGRKRKLTTTDKRFNALQFLQERGLYRRDSNISPLTFWSLLSSLDKKDDDDDNVT